MSNDTDAVLSACNALSDAARENLLPQKARALALQLRDALLFQQSQIANQTELLIVLSTVVLQMKDTDARYADADLLHTLRMFVKAVDLVRREPG